MLIYNCYTVSCIYIVALVNLPVRSLLLGVKALV